MKGGWGFTLDTGQLCNSACVAKSEKVYDCNSHVGILLNMDDYEITFYVNKEKILSYTCHMWKVENWICFAYFKGRTLFPAVSLLQHQDQITLLTNVPKPQ